MHQSLKCNMSQINCTELTQFDWIIDLHRKLCNSLNPDHLDTICDILNNEEDKEEKWKWKDYFQKWWWGNHATYRASWHNLFLLGPVYLVFPKILNDVNWSIIVQKSESEMIISENAADDDEKCSFVPLWWSRWPLIQHWVSSLWSESPAKPIVDVGPLSFLVH